MITCYASTFIDALGRLQGHEQKLVKAAAFDLQIDPTENGKSFHRIERARDPDIRVHDEGGDLISIEVAGVDMFKGGQIESSSADEIAESVWTSLKCTCSWPFPRPTSGQVADKVINHLGDEVMKVVRV